MNGGTAIAIPRRSERGLYPLDDGIEDPTLVRGIDHRETVDEPAGAAEDYFFIEGLPVSFSREDEPGPGEPPIVDPVLRVGLLRDVVLVGRRALSAVVCQGANQQAGLAAACDKHLAVTGLGCLFQFKQVVGVAQGKSKALVAIFGPPLFKAGVAGSGLSRNTKGEGDAKASLETRFDVLLRLISGALAMEQVIGEGLAR